MHQETDDYRKRNISQPVEGGQVNLIKFNMRPETIFHIVKLKLNWLNYAFHNGLEYP